MTGRLARWFGLPPLPAAARAALLVALLVAGLNFLATRDDVRDNGGTDLRARVVGARALVLGLDPYRPLPPEWAGREWLYDPHGPYRDVSRCPYAPPLLAVYALPCWLPYPVQRTFWFLAEWAALLAAIGCLARTVPTSRTRTAFVVLALVFFAGGAFWRLHVERGQYYAFVLLLESAAAWMLLRGRGDEARAGVPLGLAAALRPTLAVMAVPLWLLGRRRAAASMIASLAVVVLVLLPVTGLRLWQDYARLVSIFEAAVPGLPALAAPPSGGWVEGANFSRVLPHRSANTNLHLALVVLNDRAGWPELPQIPIVVKGAFLAALAALLLLAWRLRGAPPSARTALAVAFTFAMITEHFLPVRWGYNDTLYLAPLALLVPWMARRRGQVLLLVVLAALVIGHGLAPLPGPAWSSIARSVLLSAALVGWLAAVARARRARRSLGAFAPAPMSGAAAGGR